MKFEIARTPHSVFFTLPYTILNYIDHVKKSHRIWTLKLCVKEELLKIYIRKNIWNFIPKKPWVKTRIGVLALCVLIIVTSSTTDIFFENTKFSKILSKLTLFSKILSKFDKIFENFRKKCQFRKYFRKFCNFEKSVMVNEVNIRSESVN